MKGFKMTQEITVVTEKILVPAYGQLKALKVILEQIMPKGKMSADRLIMMVIDQLKKNPKLNSCCPVSICGSVLTCAQFGLEPGLQGRAWLIPFDDWKTKKTNATFMLGYTGMIELCYRSDRIASVEAVCVYENEEFHIERGSTAHIKHIPKSSKSRGEIIGAYCIVTNKEGYKQFDFMDYEEIEHVRTEHASKKSEAWLNHWPEMAKKTVIKRLLKLIPSSTELQEALYADDQCSIMGNTYTIDLAKSKGIIIDEDTQNVVDIKSQSDKLVDKLGG
jgi:recombination protein RecT